MNVVRKPPPCFRAVDQYVCLSPRPRNMKTLHSSSVNHSQSRKGSVYTLQLLQQAVTNAHSICGAVHFAFKVATVALTACLPSTAVVRVVPVVAEVSFVGVVAVGVTGDADVAGVAVEAEGADLVDTAAVA